MRTEKMPVSFLVWERGAGGFPVTSEGRVELGRQTGGGGGAGLPKMRPRGGGALTGGAAARWNQGKCSLSQAFVSC